MKPTLGRIVLYKSQGVVVPAIVVKIWSGECVNLYVFEDGCHVSAYGIRTSVVRGGEDGEPAEATWAWPRRELPKTEVIPAAATPAPVATGGES